MNIRAVNTWSVALLGLIWLGGTMPALAQVSTDVQSYNNAKPKEKTTVVKQTLEQEFTVDLPMQRLKPPCKGQIQLEYLQYDTIARVETALEGTICPIADMSFALVVRTRLADNSVNSARTEYTWNSKDAGPVPGSGDHPIGDDVDLVDVRAKNFKCSCETPSAAPEPPTAPPP